MKNFISSLLTALLGGNIIAINLLVALKVYRSATLIDYSESLAWVIGSKFVCYSLILLLVLAISYFFLERIADYNESGTWLYIVIEKIPLTIISIYISVYLFKSII